MRKIYDEPIGDFAVEPCATVNRNTAHSAGKIHSASSLRFVPEAQFHRHEHTSSDTTRNYRVHFSSELLALFLTVCGYSVDCDTEQCVLIYVGSFVPRYGDHLGQGKHRRIREQS